MPVGLDGDLVFCPICKRATRLLRISKAAVLVDVSRRTIYNYVEEGSVYSIKIAGKTLRICASCLLGENNVIPSTKTERSFGVERIR